MSWELRYARDGWAIESGQYSASSGGKIPAWYHDRPLSYRGDDFFLRAFWELSSCRQYGQVIGPIPWDRIIEYGYHKRLNRGMIDVLETVIRELDEAWLSWQRDSQATKK